jgi:hopene-associated glycosyltransferase HpnB
MPAGNLSWAMVLGALSALGWLYLVFLRGGFWRCSERLEAPAEENLPEWPAVAAIVPARNEEATIGRCIEGLLAQDSPGSLAILLVDDGSTDRTVERARGAERSSAGRSEFAVLRGEPLSPGWTGKLWALDQGVRSVVRDRPEIEFLWFSDADILHSPEALRALVGKAVRGGRDLASLMVRLNCESGWERLLIPAFVFFFQKLYPFPSANDDRSRTAAAAGGCVLVRRSALERIGGLRAIRGALIDDCSLARAVKGSGGRIWIGLTRMSRSLRIYAELAPVWRMVARSAFTQLRHSGALLLATVLGMAWLYLLPPILLVAGMIEGDAAVAALGFLAWALMALSYAPTLRYLDQPVSLAPGLPVAALLYICMTLDSARQHWTGGGSRWKGRSYHPAAGTR